jgi:Domain of unknown function (DUF3536)/Glycosyl hydrolase family 57
VERGNLRRIGWDLGPTLARWMRREDPALHAAWVAADDGHAAIAQAFHHAILPLASVRDRRTEVRWGLRDFELRFGRSARGMWLPETAVDALTLRICAEEGVRWTILAPWQAAGAVPDRQPRAVQVGDRRIGVLFYDADLSASVSFDPHMTENADRFARTLLKPHLTVTQPDTPPAPRSRRGRAHATRSPSHVVLIATDGELYGHHQPFRDLFLARLMTLADGFATTLPGERMDDADVAELETIGILDATSWSCHHGVERWTASCGCVPDGSWKRPLRQALDRLAAGLDAASQAALGRLELDLWSLRDAYVDVAAGFAEGERWLHSQPSGRRLSPKDRELVLSLLAAQESRLEMFASDGWFWGDPRRVETRAVLRFAAHAARLVDGALGTQLERGLAMDLEAVRAPAADDGSAPDGLELYTAALAAVGQPGPPGSDRRP